MSVHSVDFVRFIFSLFLSEYDRCGYFGLLKPPPRECHITHSVQTRESQMYNARTDIETERSRGDVAKGEGDRKGDKTP